MFQNDGCAAGPFDGNVTSGASEGKLRGSEGEQERSRRSDEVTSCPRVPSASCLYPHGDSAHKNATELAALLPQQAAQAHIPPYLLPRLALGTRALQSLPPKFQPHVGSEVTLLSREAVTRSP